MTSYNYFGHPGSTIEDPAFLIESIELDGRNVTSSEFPLGLNEHPDADHYDFALMRTMGWSLVGAAEHAQDSARIVVRLPREGVSYHVVRTAGRWALPDTRYRTERQLAQDAMLVQDASNLAGVTRAMNEGAVFLLRVGKRQETHPAMILFASKVHSLCGAGLSDQEVFNKAWSACETLAKPPEPHREW